MTGIDHEFAGRVASPRTLLDVLGEVEQALGRATAAPVAQFLSDAAVGRASDPEMDQQRVESELNAIMNVDINGLPDAPGDDLLILLADPLSNATRAVRRNLIVASGVALFVGLSPSLPKKVPGFDLEIAEAGWLVLLAIGVVVLWELISFYLYFDNDTRRLRLSDEGVTRVRREMERLTAEIKSRLPVIDTAPEGLRLAVGMKVKTVLAIGGEYVRRYEASVRSVGFRRFLDGRLVFALAGLALAVLVCRGFCMFPSVRFGWIDPYCR